MLEDKVIVFLILVIGCLLVYIGNTSYIIPQSQWECSAYDNTHQECMVYHRKDRP